MLLALACALGVLAPLGVSLAQTARPSKCQGVGPAARQERRWQALDRGDFQSAGIESFYFRDKNKNGYLTIEELKEASPEALKTVRRKASGQITLQEYANALFRGFEAADTDQDGLLAVAEIEIYIRNGK